MLHFSSHMQTLALLHTHTRTHTQYESRRGILWEKEWCQQEGEEKGKAMGVKYEQNTTKISQWNPLFAMLTKANQQNFKKRTVYCGNKLVDRRSVTWVYLMIGLRADLSLLQFELAGDRQTEIKTVTLGFAQISHTRQASNPAGKCKVQPVQMTAALRLMYKVKSSLGELFFLL